jgi:hypothetical protein
MFADRLKAKFVLQESFSADATRALGRANGDILIESVDVFNYTNLATSATNYVTLKLINLGTDAQGTTVIASASTSQTTGSAMAANVAFPLTVVAAAKLVSSGQTIGFIYDESSTDVANGHVLNVVVNYQQVGAP